MKKPTATFVVFLLFFAAFLIGPIWTLCGGAADGSKMLMYWTGGIALAVAVLSKVLGGAWFTDSANGR